MKTSDRCNIDRRNDQNNRQVYDLNYFLDGGIERRAHRERRTPVERRDDWTKISEWHSLPLNSLICAEDFTTDEDCARCGERVQDGESNVKKMVGRTIQEEPFDALVSSHSDQPAIRIKSPWRSADEVVALCSECSFNTRRKSRTDF